MENIDTVTDMICEPSKWPERARLMQDETKTKVLSRYQSSDSMTTSSSPLFVDECKLHKLSPLSDKMIDISWATPTQETDCLCANVEAGGEGNGCVCSCFK